MTFSTSLRFSIRLVIWLISSGFFIQRETKGKNAMLNKFLRISIVAISCVGIQIASTTLTTAVEDIPGMGKRFHSYVSRSHL